MKHRIIRSVLFMLMSLSMGLVITSCSDDTNELKPKEPRTETLPMDYRYVQPFLQWGATAQEVANFMEGWDGWNRLGMESSEFTDVYATLTPLTYVYYHYDALQSLGLNRVTVMYYANHGVQELKAKLEQAHRCQLNPVVEADETIVYKATDVMIQGKEAEIVLSSTQSDVNGTFTVYYTLE